MSQSIKNLSQIAFELRSAADTHPIFQCCDAPHERHKAEFENGLKIVFTHDIRDGTRHYYLSIRGSLSVLTDEEVKPFLESFFKQDKPIQELGDIQTPNVRCFSQLIE